jgi:hypothetical protein
VYGMTGDDFLYRGEICRVHGSKGWVTEWTPRMLKSGKLSTKTYDYMSHEFTPLRTCGMCGKVSTPKKICDRDLHSPYNHSWYRVITSKEEAKAAKWGGWEREKEMLCMRCWNKAIGIIKKEDRLQDNIKLLKQLTTEIYHERKKLKHLSTSN